METMATRLYAKLDLQTVAFAIVDPITRQSAKIEHGNQHCKRYRFPDGSIVRIYNGDANFRWFICIGVAVKGVGYIGPDVARIDGSTLQSVEKYPLLTR